MAQKDDSSSRQRNLYKISFPGTLSYGQLIAIRQTVRNRFQLRMVVKESTEGYFFNGTEDEIKRVLERLNIVAERFQYGSNLFKGYTLATGNIYSTPNEDHFSLTEVIDDAVNHCSKGYLAMISGRDKKVRDLQSQVEHLIRIRDNSHQETQLLTEKARLLEDRLGVETTKYEQQIAAAEASHINTEKALNVALNEERALSLGERVFREARRIFQEVSSSYEQALQGTTLAELKSLATTPEEYAQGKIREYAEKNGIENVTAILQVNIHEPEAFAGLTREQYQKVCQELEGLKSTIDNATESVRGIITESLKSEISNREESIRQYVSAEQNYLRETEKIRSVKRIYEDAMISQQEKREWLETNFTAYAELAGKHIPVVVKPTSSAVTISILCSGQNLLLSEELRSLTKADSSVFSLGETGEIGYGCWGGGYFELLSTAVSALSQFSQIVQDKTGLSLRPYFITEK